VKPTRRGKGKRKVAVKMDFNGRRRSWLTTEENDQVCCSRVAGRKSRAKAVLHCSVASLREATVGRDDSPPIQRLCQLAMTYANVTPDRPLPRYKCAVPHHVWIIWGISSVIILSALEGV